MSKSTKNNQSYNADILNELVKKYGVTKKFIRESIRGDRTSLTSDSIKKDYTTLLASSRRAIEKKCMES